MTRQPFLFLLRDKKINRMSLEYLDFDVARILKVECSNLSKWLQKQYNDIREKTPNLSYKKRIEFLKKRAFVTAMARIPAAELM